MSTTPLARHYASHPNSPPTPISSSSSTAGISSLTFSTSTTDQAAVRSQAIAKLKRAASLPRQPDGRRPSHSQQPPNGSISAHDKSAQTQLVDSYPSSSSSPPPPLLPLSAPAYLHSSTVVMNRNDEEILTQSPVAHIASQSYYSTPINFDNVPLVHSSNMGMQRSASATSSFDTSSSSHMYTGVDSTSTSPFYTVADSPAGTPDCASMNFAQSYLPTLSPTVINPSQLTAPPALIGRNTPSPLPTLGELGALSRSNSAAARAKAMSKLTGGREHPSPRQQNDEDEILAMSARSKLHRADTVGAIRALTSASAAPHAFADAPEDAENDGAVAIGQRHASPNMIENVLLPRPRLQRSFTVSSSNMREERRSAVGRRMVARLAERKVARENEEDEVRKMWEERRGGGSNSHVVEDQAVQDDEDEDEVGNEGGDGFEGMNIPRLERTSPEQPIGTQRHFVPTLYEADALSISSLDRTMSRNTQRSVDDAFEFESHLRRSMSSRTARGELDETHPSNQQAPVLSSAAFDSETTPVALPISSGVFPDNEDVSVHFAAEDENGELKAPSLPFVTPSKRQGTHSSTSSQATIQGDNSPGGHSSVSGDGLNSMMFVIGSGHSALGNNGELLNRSWPSEVEENGASDWGTPSKASDTGPMSHAVAISEEERNDPGEADHLPRESTDSPMSWEEVGGVQDREIPSDSRYLTKSNSVGARMGRAVKTAIRQGSQSRGSTGTVSTTSPPTSPRQLVNAVFARRSSQTSVPPSQATFAPSLAAGGQLHAPASVSSTSLPPTNPRHQPSINSLAASINIGAGVSGDGGSSTNPSASANSILLQHQLASAEPSPVSFVPRAELSDPRIHLTKLSPFPGISVLEPRAASLEPSGTITDETPKLTHQVSDSVVPSNQRGQPAEPIYSLPPPVVGAVNVGGRRESADDSSGKRSWLARAFGQTSTRTSASGSGSLSRSNSDQGHENGGVAGNGGYTSDLDKDPFAAPTPAYNFHSVSGKGGACIPQTTGMLPMKSMNVLSRMDDVLALAPDDPARPDFLDDPPRKLLLATQVLQVVNVHTVKDRYLFLFNDILVIAKPLITQGIIATLDMKFIVKSVVSLDKLFISGISEEPATEPPRHPIVESFIQQFAQDPLSAVRYLVERSNPRVDVATVSSLIFKTPELDKTQIGYLLAGNEALMKAFIDRFQFSGVRIDDALRMFLLSLRLPNETSLSTRASEILLRGFADGYFNANMDNIPYNRETVGDLVVAILDLNDSLHHSYSTSAAQSAEFTSDSRSPMTSDHFIDSFTVKDPQGHVSVELLDSIYQSIKSVQLVQALGKNESLTLTREIKTIPARLPSKLTYKIWSDPIKIVIPRRDGHFKIRLLGTGLEFDPPMLEFEDSNEASFRIKGMSLGVKSMFFDRMGANAALYAGIGNTRSFSVERAFMRHTFHVAFVSHLGLKRKYCFSVNDLSTRRKWIQTLTRQIRITTINKENGSITGGVNLGNSKVRKAAEAVSLQVLRDALIPPEESVVNNLPTVSSKNTLSTTNSNGFNNPIADGRMNSNGKINSEPMSTPASASTANQGGGNQSKRSTSTRMNRSGSVSIAYLHQAGIDEADLGPLQATRAHNTESNSGLIDIQTGKELVLLCRQNSLLPGLLELLQVGVDGPGESEAMRAANLRARMQGKRV